MMVRPVCKLVAVEALPTRLPVSMPARPPLNAMEVEVAFEGKGYPIVLVMTPVKGL